MEQRAGRLCRRRNAVLPRRTRIFPTGGHLQPNVRPSAVSSILAFNLISEIHFHCSSDVDQIERSRKSCLDHQSQQLRRTIGSGEHDQVRPFVDVDESYPANYVCNNQLFRLVITLTYSISAGLKPLIINYMLVDFGTGILIAPLAADQGTRFAEHLRTTVFDIHRMFQQTLKAKVWRHLDHFLITSQVSFILFLIFKFNQIK